MTRLCILLGLSPVLCLFFAAPLGAVDFNRDIRPILSDNCFACHGPGEEKGDLRLDVRELAMEAGAIVAGSPETSEAIYRIFTEDRSEIMPPPKSKKELTAAQKNLLKEWIAQGAEYADHWAFIPPSQPELPQVSDMAWPKQPLDHFILARLDAEGLTPSPEATREILIRRATFDLTGLPPTPEEVDAFLKDTSPNAWEKVVDRLLDSPRYGERMTLAWMDAARYGDTSVMHADGPRDMWPWRDWVIEAYNTNKPFDQFTIEQLAGDLLPKATVPQMVASGFNRHHATSDEGGAFAEELRVDYVVDRVATTSKVWMGLTMECAQCHDHKYDPISQEEYYQFFAYFNNTTDPGMQTRKGNQAPVVTVPDPVRDQKIADLEKRIVDLDNQLEKYRQDAQPAFTAWAEKETQRLLNSEEPVSPSPDDLIAWFPLDETKGNTLDNAFGAALTRSSGKLQGSKRNREAALKIDGKTVFAGESVPDLEWNQAFSFSAWLKVAGNAGGAVFSRMDTKSKYRGYDLWLQGGAVGTHIIHSWPGNAVKVVSQTKLKPNTWQHVVVTYDGKGSGESVRIYIDGEAVPTKVEAGNLTGSIATDQPFRIGSRSQGANFTGEVDDIRIFSRALQAEEVGLVTGDPIQGILARPAQDRSDNQVKALFSHYLAKQDKGWAKLQNQRNATANQKASLEVTPTTSMVMRDNPPDKMRMTYVLDRGAYDSPKEDEAMQPGVPAALPPLPDEAPGNRLGLAQWLTNPDHPLTARVAVNRYWLMFFGHGLVETVGDFGSQGSSPTHPELLDWLAVDFAESGWNVKRMVKQMLMSATWRQSAVQSESLREEDPQNLLLARGPRFRLQGEFIRDQALFISGLMNHQVGGPGVKPYQPPNIWNEVSLNGGLRYQQDSGDKLHRRSMYTYWRRSSPMPNMLIFDSPTREKCVIQRPRTNTPLQTLVTLNDPQFVEAARALAERLLKERSDDASRIHLAYRLATARPATEREQTILQQILQGERERFAQSPDKATELLKVGEAPRDAALDPAEHAAWTIIAQMILNLDETLTRG